MSEISCPVIEISNIEKHPDADSLSLVKVFGSEGYTVVVRNSDFLNEDGSLKVQKAIYFPVDSVLPDREEFKFLEGHLRLRAKRLRGIFSQGLLLPTDLPIGYDVGEEWGVKKYQPPEVHGGNSVKTGFPDHPPPFLAPEYTDIENARKYWKYLPTDQELVCTEKIHGMNGRWVYDKNEDKFHAGTHHRWVKESQESIPWQVLTDRFKEVLKLFPRYIFFGEIYGWIQDLKYGHSQGQYSIRLFDIFDSINGRYLDWEDLNNVQEIARAYSIDSVPIVHVGYFNMDYFQSLCERDSIVYPGQIMEGIVIRPKTEMIDPKGNRIIYKLISERYLLRKNG